MAIDYGRDLSCVTDLTAEMAEVSGRRLLGEALARRLVTPRGSLLDDPNYGFDVRDYIADDQSVSALPIIAASIDAEFRKDERVIDSRTTIQLAGTGVLTISSTVTDSAGPFQLVVAVGDLDVANGIVVLKIG